MTLVTTRGSVKQILSDNGQWRCVIDSCR